MIIENWVGSKDKYDERTDSHKSLLGLNDELVENLWRNHSHWDDVNDIVMIDDVPKLPEHGPHQVHVDLPDQYSGIEAASATVGVDLRHWGSGIHVQPDIIGSQRDL